MTILSVCNIVTFLAIFYVAIVFYHSPRRALLPRSMQNIGWIILASIEGGLMYYSFVPFELGVRVCIAVWFIWYASVQYYLHHKGK